MPFKVHTFCRQKKYKHNVFKKNQNYTTMFMKSTFPLSWIYIFIYIYMEIYIQFKKFKGNRGLSGLQKVTSLSLSSLSRLRRGWWQSLLA